MVSPPRQPAAPSQIAWRKYTGHSHNGGYVMDEGDTALQYGAAQEYGFATVCSYNLPELPPKFEQVCIRPLKPWRSEQASCH
jgi:hypothetical protein